MLKIAIDGPAGSGKSTISKIIATKLGIEYIDTGAMYRAITLKAIQLGIDIDDESQYHFLESTSLDICNGRFIMDGVDVSDEIRSVEVTNAVSTPSKMAKVREYLVEYQQKISNSKNCIMDGRDIGTVVLPDASIKIYLDATIECRARRRMLERKEKGIDLSLEETIKEIELRDWKDSTRKHSPLRCAEDAIVIDSTDLSIDEVVSRIINLVNERTKKMSKYAYKEGQNVRGMIINVTKDAIYLTVDEDNKAVIYANDLKGYQEGQKLYDTYYEGQEFEGLVKQITKDKKTGEPLFILSTTLQDEKDKLTLFEQLKENDEIIKALAFNQSVRIYAVSNTNTLNEIGKRLHYYPSALDAMGRVLSMGAMMGSMLKLEETITLKVEGDGPIGKIIVDSDAHGNIRGYCDNPHCHFEYNDFRLNAKQTIGTTGFISVIKDLKLKEPFIGSTPIISGEIAEDFAYYFQVSEQIPSAVGLGVLVDTNNMATSSGGFIVQLMPNTSEEVIYKLEEKLKLIPTVSEMLSSGYTVEDMIYNIAEDVEILEKIPLNFRCNCSKERFARGILSLGAIEIKEMIDENKTQETTCHFCGNKYYFTKEDLDDLYKIAKEKECKTC